MSGEDAFIRRHFALLAGAGSLGLRDDAALIAPPPGTELVVTADAIVAGVHFLADDPIGDVARKALRVNLSDLAAKGAAPLGFLLTLALPAGFSDPDAAAFADALGEDASLFACALLGGDTVSTPGPMTVAITAIGTVPAGTMVRRDGARAGDALYVTGTIGDAALGLLAARDDARLAPLADADRAALIDRYRRPQPRTLLIRVLRDYATAAMDVSDGLAGDLSKMLSLAGLAAEIAVADVPLSSAGRRALDLDATLLNSVLSGGDDYEIICSVPSSKAAAFEHAAQAAGVQVARLGTARAGKTEVEFKSKDGRAVQLDRLSFSHV